MRPIRSISNSILATLLLSHVVAFTDPTPNKAGIEKSLPEAAGIIVACYEKSSLYRTDERPNAIKDTLSQRTSAKDSLAQQTRKLIDACTDRNLRAMKKRYRKMEQQLLAFNIKSLGKMRKQESKLLQALPANDSVARQKLEQDGAEKYAALVSKLKSTDHVVTSGALNTYLPRLDSLKTSFEFLAAGGAKLPGISAEKIGQLKDVSEQLKKMDAQLQAAGTVKQFLQERKQLWKEQLSRTGMPQQLKGITKNIYYCQQQFNDYKALLRDPDKLAKKIMALVHDVPAFQSFFAQNSMLAQLFGSQGNGSMPGSAVQGLQARASVQQQMAQQLGSANINPQQFIQQQVGGAQSQVSELKNKLNQMGGGNGELEMPEFKPNHQKTKSFWKRVEYGINIQSQKTNALLPVTSDIAFTAGYKLNDKSVIGIGAGVKLGWGDNISHIRLSSEGASLRSFADVKLKGSFWISGGYELNYQQAFQKIEQLKNLDAWQHSGLLGLSKKYKIGKKSGNLQLLWDFLSYSQVPRTQALKFRLGYTF